jgi:Flp pilus assembly protein protease CpaA
MWLPFFLFALPISLADVRNLIIPNVYLLWLSVLCSPYILFNGLGRITVLIFAFTLLVLLYLVGLGMGDVKLIAIIVVYLNSRIQTNLIELAVSILLCAGCHIFLNTLRNRKIPSKAALAPSIFAGLALYLATS